MRFEIGAISGKFELDDSDLVPLRQMLSKAVANGVYNAIRALVNDGIITSLTGTQEDAEDSAAPEATAAPEQPAPQPEPPAYGRYMEREPDPLPRPIEKKERTKIGKILDTVHIKPAGFITTDQAAALMVGDNASSNKVQLGVWIRTKQVRAAIVDDKKLPPTKGAGGRVMVDKQSLIARDKLRRENAKLSPRDRQPFQEAAD